MSPETIEAISVLQGKLQRSTDSYYIERFGFALDELTRNPDRRGPVAHLIRNATANAGKKQKRRKQDQKITFASADVYEEVGQPIADIRSTEAFGLAEWSSDIASYRASLDEVKAQIIDLLMDGWTTAEIASYMDWPMGVTAVRVSRLRASLKRYLFAALL